jgi:hypothetical protein
MISQSDKKSSFYPRFQDDLTSCGYEFWDEIKGKGPSHSSKPDYLARKGQFIVIGEIKSPSEGPLTPSWRVPQHSDTDEFVRVRQCVAKRERDGLISRKAGGHEIIIRGQIPDYLSKIGQTYDPPFPLLFNVKFMGAYSSPQSESANIEQAFSNCRKKFSEKIIGREGTVTYIFAI